MDLDSSFALVSSLTPRSHPTGTILTENNKLSSKSRKIKTTKSVPSQSQSTKSYRQRKENNKENYKAGQLMNRDEHLQQDIIPYVDNSCVNKKSPCYPVDMANIAIRSNKSSRGRRKKPLSLCSIKNSLSSDNVGSNNDRFCDSSKTELIIKRSNEDFVNREISFASCNISNSSATNLTKNGRKRKSAQRSPSSKALDISDSLIDFVDSSCSGIKLLPSETSKRFSIDSSMTKSQSNSPLRDSDLIETSLSTAYDSGSFHTVRRRRAKVISETPDSEESLKNNSRTKKKCSLDSILSNSDKGKRSSRASATSKLSCSSSSLKSESSDKIQSTKNYNISNHCENPEKKLSSSKSSLNDTFNNESFIKSDLNIDKKVQGNGIGESTNIELEGHKIKSVMTPVLQETLSKVVIEKKVDRGKQLRNIKTVEDNVECVIKKGKKSKEKSNDKYSRNIKNKTNTEKSSFIPPSEVIPKFEHINNWLKDTEENSVIVLSSDSSFNSPEIISKPTKSKSRKLKSLSPRIKKKIKEAQAILEEEQHIFEELYGSDLVKRLSEETEDNLSIESTRQSLEISEKVLEKIYGTVWQKDEVIPKSEPRKGRPINSSKKKGPQTERKKHRTSIYDVFSSSSSEDRFEEFLENVHRGKLKTTHKINNQSGTPDFINDSDSDCETSFTYYQSALSSAVKEDIEKLRSPKLNRRRLSFASSQEECSESGRSNSKPKGKEKKSDSKNKKQESRHKKRSEKGFEDKRKDDDANSFSLVTPIKVKDKKSDKNIDVRIKDLIENELPKSVGKSKTPKNNVNNTNTEDRLREKYLNRSNFKVPKQLNSLRTPNKPSKAGIPSSPALSFLSSLSEVTAGLPSHPDALVYKKNFKDKREELAKKLFSLYNKEVFENQLPANMMIEWSTRMTSTSGFCYNKRIYCNNQIFRSSRIVLSAKILDRADRLRDTLIHELCHAATWIVNGTSDGHGPKWKAWADKANRRFPELPVIKRCHDYAISTKFTYKCMSCGYSIGRHSKSLNTDRKRCGFCFGKFEVFVTAKMSTASVTSGSDSVKTQRTPSGFALFVKENYATVKKENNVPHGQVMKLLSQKFAEVKICKQKEKET